MSVCQERQEPHETELMKREDMQATATPGTTSVARDRIKSVPELAEIAERARSEGRSVVLAHGVFDLLHLGHVRHLEAARKLGDVLIVTVTGDAFVRKGPGRPVFAQTMRAEMLAALDYVDWTGINRAPTADPLIEAIQPDVYVKGSDYVDPKFDVTSNITRERELTEKYGGRLCFTDEVTFSSSGLINEYFEIHDPEARAFIDELRRNGGADRTLEMIDRLSELRVLILGETIMDEYDYVEALGKSSKENIIATLYQDREVFAGGVIAAANHIGGFCKDVEVVTCLGAPDEQEVPIRDYLRSNVTLTPYYDEQRPTIRKCRYVEKSTLRKLFEVYYMDDSPLEAETGKDVAGYLAGRCGEFDLVIVCDFGHGMMVDPIIDTVGKHAKFLAINAQANAGNLGYNRITKYQRADYICVDEKEARSAAYDKSNDLERIVSEVLPASIDCGRIAATLGPRGSLCWDNDSGLVHVPAFAHNPVDTIGAGDAFLVVTSALFAAGGNPKEVAFIGNVVGGIKTGIVGHRQSVDKGVVKNTIVSLLK